MNFALWRDVAGWLPAMPLSLTHGTRVVLVMLSHPLCQRHVTEHPYLYMLRSSVNFPLLCDVTLL
jgi:hypothetical protein